MIKLGTHEKKYFFIQPATKTIESLSEKPEIPSPAINNKLSHKQHIDKTAGRDRIPQTF